jgi:secreted Zn-dependent insulinase-like peptidase
MYNIVTRGSIINEFKKSKYYKQNLGLVTTVEHNGQRKYNDKDKFMYFYNTTYKTNVNMQGTIGDIIVYLDYYINEDVIALYYNTEEFIFNYDPKMVKDKGIDFYLGHLLKKMETEYEERIKKSEEKQLDVKKEGNADTLKLNPGAVTYDDLKKYLEQKNKSRFSSENS